MLGDDDARPRCAGAQRAAPTRRPRRRRRRDAHPAPAARRRCRSATSRAARRGRRAGGAARRCSLAAGAVTFAAIADRRRRRRRRPGHAARRARRRTARSSRSCRSSRRLRRRGRRRARPAARPATSSASCPARARRAAPRSSAAYRRQFADSDTRSFEVAGPRRPRGGATGRASGRYVATYARRAGRHRARSRSASCATAATPRIALISARQDTPARSSAVAGDAQRDLAARQDLRAGARLHRAHLRVARQERVEEAARVLARDLQAEALELLLGGVGVARRRRRAAARAARARRAARRSRPAAARALAATSIRFAPGSSATSVLKRPSVDRRRRCRAPARSRARGLDGAADLRSARRACVSASAGASSVEPRRAARRAAASRSSPQAAASSATATNGGDGARAHRRSRLAAAPADASRVVGLVADQPTEPADWSAALQQVFAEPWRVRPAFQPIVDLERRQVWGFQVLARFISPLRATPPEWLDAAERLGLRQALESRLLAAGLGALPDVPERGRLLLPDQPVDAVRGRRSRRSCAST